MNPGYPYVYNLRYSIFLQTGDLSGVLNEKIMHPLILQRKLANRNNENNIFIYCNRISAEILQIPAIKLAKSCYLITAPFTVTLSHTTFFIASLSISKGLLDFISRLLKVKS